ncbi:hypothetical protein UB44_01560 [Burkholderiaceae bacterium 26]|uniref:hypothetical protein n=1 Tax=Ralstonia sp. TaxID=54061 RepID=UPI0005EB8DED|nr:hypothetical protein [Ralstonia sp.]KJK04988.1 hypothetical protein UB44_01560 [Burkholderiaceae bacterium 26]HWV05828.1 hypothetical protein [Ralstonia sp.]
MPSPQTVTAPRTSSSSAYREPSGVRDYTADAAFRSEFHRWLAQLWEEKDAQIDAMLARAALKNQ